MFHFARSGDADLYVSKTLLKPSFDPEEFDFSSATCGRDLVDIPRAYVLPYLAYTVCGVY